jgi:hypothetical protein
MKCFSAASLTLCLLILPACRFKVPTPEEQQELLARGTFPGAVPAWVSAEKGSRNQSLSAVVPSAFSAPIHTASSFARSTTESDPRDLKTEEQNRQVGKAPQPKVDNSEAGALSRLMAQCPNVEEEAKEALVNTDPYTRMEQYRALSQRCPESADVWFWLGKDYLAEGRLLEARNCLENAVLRNRSLDHARTLFEAVDSQLNKKQSSD